jgi:hypothetical protein
MPQEVVGDRGYRFRKNRDQTRNNATGDTSGETT